MFRHKSICFDCLDYIYIYIYIYTAGFSSRDWQCKSNAVAGSWISHGAILIISLVAAVRSSANILSRPAIHILNRPPSGQPETSMAFSVDKVLDQLPAVQTAILAKLVAMSSWQLPSSPISTFLQRSGSLRGFALLPKYKAKVYHYIVSSSFESNIFKCFSETHWSLTNITFV